MSEAWELTRRHFTKAQKHQKRVYYDQRAKNPFRAGEREFLFKPAEQTGARRKFARPFHGPYRLVEVGTNTARICPVDKPESEPILVSLDRLRRCPEEVGDKFWPPNKKTRQSRQARSTLQLSGDTEEKLQLQESYRKDGLQGKQAERYPWTTKLERELRTRDETLRTL